MVRYKTSMRAYVLVTEHITGGKSNISSILSIEGILNAGLNEVRFNTEPSWRNQLHIVMGMFKGFGIKQT